MRFAPCRMGWATAVALLALMCAPSPASAAVRKVGSGVSSEFGLDNNLLAQWSFGYVQENIQGLIVNTMTVCPGVDGIDDDEDGKMDRCGSGNYMFLFQIPYGPDNAVITFSNLQGFNGADTSYGFMACSATAAPPDFFVQTTVALCTPDPENTLFDSMNADVQIPGDNSSLTLSFAPFFDPVELLNTTRFPLGGITVFIRESAGFGAGPPPTPSVSITGGSGVTLLPLDVNRVATDGQVQTSLTFGSTRVGEQSEIQSVVLLNGGLSPLNISSILTAGNFSVTDTCPDVSPLAPQESCTLFVRFVPPGVGIWTGWITITHDGPSAEHAVNLWGYGDASDVVLSASTLDFGSEPVSTSAFAAPGSPQQAVQVTNASSTFSVVLSDVSVSVNPATGTADFSVSTNMCDFSCESNVCSVSVTAHPRLLGPASATLTITDTDNNLHYVFLRAVGSTPQALPDVTPPYVLLNPSNATFPAQNIGTVSPTPAQFNGTASLFVPSAGYLATPTGSFSVEFSPVTLGKQKGSVHIYNHVSTGLDVVFLSGVALRGIVSFSPPAVGFGNQLWGTTSGAQSVVLANERAETLNISAINITGGNSADFQVEHDCGGTLSSTDSCNLNVTFAPTASGPRKSLVTISTDAAESPHKVLLTGMGVALGVQPASLDFPFVFIGSSSSPLAVTLTNVGSVPVHLWQVAVTGDHAGDFIPGTSCPVPPATLAGGENCTINVTFVPKGIGTRSALLQVSHDGGGSPSSVALSGTADVNVDPPCPIPPPLCPPLAPTATTLDSLQNRGGSRAYPERPGAKGKSQSAPRRKTPAPQNRRPL